MSPVGGYGACRFGLSGSNLKLSLDNGNNLQINGTVEPIPNAGVTLGTTGLSANTTYYIYAYMDSGTMKLEASTTAYVTDTGSGNEGVVCKSAAATRTLVGMARTNGSTQWVDSATQRFVLNWFNKRCVAAFREGLGDLESTSQDMTEMTETKVEFLSWEGHTTIIKVSGCIQNSTALNESDITVGIDGVNQSSGSSAGVARVRNVDANEGSQSDVEFPTVLSEGYHTASLFIKVRNASTVYIHSATARTIVYVEG